MTLLNSIHNFLDYLRTYISFNPAKNILINYEISYQDIVNKINQVAKERNINIQFNDLVNDKQKILDFLPECELAIFFFDHYTRKDLKPGYAEYLEPFSHWLNQNAKKALMLSDIKENFYNVYSIPINRILKLNESLIDIANTSSCLTVTNSLGTNIKIDLTNAKPWSNFNGTNLGEILPAEITTFSKDINGILYFQGAILCMIPLAVKHGLIRDTVKLEIRAGKIDNLSSDNKQLSDDLNDFLDYCDDHRIIEEIGIGTNEAVRLVGINGAFEEKHGGLHFGLGGRTEGSLHMDLMLNESILAFDGKIVYDGQFRI